MHKDSILWGECNPLIEFFFSLTSTPCCAIRVRVVALRSRTRLRTRMHARARMCARMRPHARTRTHAREYYTANHLSSRWPPGGESRNSHIEPGGTFDFATAVYIRSSVRNIL